MQATTVTEMKYEIPEHFFELFRHLSSSLQDLYDDLIHAHSIAKLSSVTEEFIAFYESFCSEKEVFDSLNACTSYDDPIYQHSIKVALLSRMMGDLHHLQKDDLDVLTQSALLHDIGKCAIDSTLLNKEEALTPQELNTIRKHAKLGHQLLRRLPLDARISAVALMHHERCDGSGYPMGIGKSNINEFARIVGICDVYCGMIANRNYRESFCPFQIIALFEKDGLQKYDTDFTILFLRSMLDTYIGYSVQLNTGEQGTITAVNPHNLSNPVISINSRTINLAVDDKRNILHIL